MKKELILSMAFIASAFIITSCSEKKEEKAVLTPETTHIKGDLADYFEVVDKEYTVTDDWGDMVSIEVKRTDVDYAFDLKGVEPYGTYGQGVAAHAGFGIEVLDEDGNVIEKTAATASGLGGMYSSDDMKEALKLKAGETGTVRWSFNFDSDEKPAKFRLTSAYETVDSSSWDSDSTTSDDDDESFLDDDDDESSLDDDDDSDSHSSSSSKDSKDWDALLKSYEQYVDKYITYVKKASKGDMSALKEYPSLMEKAEEFGNKIQNAQDDMSASQWAKYMKITQKMLSAASDINTDSKALEKATEDLNSMLDDVDDDW